MRKKCIKLKHVAFWIESEKGMKSWVSSNYRAIRPEGEASILFRIGKPAFEVVHNERHINCFFFSEMMHASSLVY